MNDNAKMSRRRFLGTATAASLSPFIKGCVQPSQEGGVPANALSEVFKDIPLTDQYNKPFDITEVIGDKPAIVLFGYNGCPMCQTITKSVAATQQLLESKEEHIPIVVISIQPEEDKEHLPEYTANYYRMGVKQFPGEKLPEDFSARGEMGENSYKLGMNGEQSDRILHVCCPPSSQVAKELEQRIARASGLLGGVAGTSSKQHSAYMTLCKDGVMFDSVRSLPMSNEQEDVSTHFTAEVARTILNRFQSLDRSR